MSEFTADDCGHMARALQLARRGLYTAHPNPRVGCVIVRGDRVVGEGWHHKTGEAHAEIHALDEAGAQADGASVYVTLEPCSHHGKTPPCTDSLIAADVREVIVACGDPNPAVAGSGIDALANAGISVRCGLLRGEALSLNEGFICRMQRGRPFVRLKIAASLDGRTATTNGRSPWISNELSREDVQRIRAESGAVMVGIGTVLADDPRLTVRSDNFDTGGRQPVRVVVDSRLRMPPSAKLLTLDGDTIVFCVDDTNRTALEDAGAQVVVVDDTDGKVDLEAVVTKLGELEINDLLVEPGATLAAAMFDAGLFDELVIYQAPHIIDSEATEGMPDWQNIAPGMRLSSIEQRSFGEDTRITLRPDGG